jgi:hypothetical protein
MSEVQAEYQTVCWQEQLIAANTRILQLEAELANLKEMVRVWRARDVAARGNCDHNAVEMDACLEVSRTDIRQA